VPGDQLSVRVLDLPFTDPRKIDQVVGYELEGQIVHALEDVVFDSTVVRQGAEGSTVLAVAAKRDDIAALIAANEAQGTHPRALYAAPVVYRTLLPARAAAASDKDEPVELPCQVILDIGHLRTNVCIVRAGQTLYARTIRRGGLQLTQAIAQAFKADHDRAEQAKRGEAYLVSAERPASSPLTAKLDAVLREALAPLVREIRQTLASFRASSKERIEAVLITGGTGRLKGLPAFLEGELGVPARFLAVRSSAEMRPHVAGRDDEPNTPVIEADESSPYALATKAASVSASIDGNPTRNRRVAL